MSLLGVGKLQFVERLLGGGLVELSLIGGRIDLGEDVAALDLLAFLEIDAENAAIDLRPYRHGVARLGGADAFEIQRHIGDAGRGDQDGHRAVAHLGAPPASRLFLRAWQHRRIDDGGGDRADDSDYQDALDELGHLPSFPDGAFLLKVLLHLVFGFPGPNGVKR